MNPYIPPPSIRSIPTKAIDGPILVRRSRPTRPLQWGIIAPPFSAVPASVSKICLVRLDGNNYSVAARAVGRPVEIHAYADRIVLRQDGEIVAKLARRFGWDQTFYDP